MKLNQKTRIKYELAPVLFTTMGNINFHGDVHAVRQFVQLINDKLDLINFPELAAHSGQIYGISLIFNIDNYLLGLYRKNVSSPSLNEELYNYLKKEIGEEKLHESMISFLKEFQPREIYDKKMTPEEFMNDETDGLENKYLILDEFILLWLENNNPAFSTYHEFIDDGYLEKTTQFNEIVDNVEDFFEDEPVFGPKNQDLIDMLREPAELFPHSITKQLEFIQKTWGSLLGDFLYQILLALDLIREEEKFRGFGPGESQVYLYDISEEEHFTPDKFWMPKVVMIAKNALVWMDQLSKQYGRSISKLHEIPDEELDKLRNWGFTALWLIGVWDRSQASKTIKRWCGNPEAEASAYSIYDYAISPDVGGYNSYKNLWERTWKRGIRLACDMVPNHMGIVSAWSISHPDWFVSLPYPPFPSYSYSGANLSGNPNIGIFLEDKYFSRTDAAVTFKHVDFYSGMTRYIYHGNDGTHLPWNDTAQLNYLIPEVREAVIRKIVDVSKLFPIIRFDAAMTLTRKHYQRLWFPEPGTGGAIPSRAEHGIPTGEFVKAMPEEFWREVVDRINKENPDTLLLAEAFWLLEGYFVRTLGMHRVYNSAFMNMLRDEDNAKYRAVLKNTLEFDPQILKRFVNFMNNPDEETAIKQFGTGDKYFGICTLMVTMPGLPMFGHGQIEGFEEKYGMEFRRAYWDEKADWGLVHNHESTIFPLMRKRYLFANVENFVLYDFWTGNFVNEDVFAYSNRFNDEKALVIYHNKFAETRGFIKNSVGYKGREGEEGLIQTSLAGGLNLPNENYCIFRDFKSGLEYIRKNNEIHDKGLYVELSAYKVFVFMDFRVVNDNQFFHFAQLHEYLNGRGVPNIEETLQEVIYQPLHDSFKEIINPVIYKNIIQNDGKIIKSKEFASKILSIFHDVKNYSNQNTSEEDLTRFKDEIVEKLKVILNLNDLIVNIPLSDEEKKFISQYLPRSIFEKAILLTWSILHNLGKLISKDDYEAISRSWIDEWRLTKLIRPVLETVDSENKEKIWESLLLIKLITNFQNLFIKEKIDLTSSNKLLISLLSNPEVQEFLKINRYQEKLWFNAEAFDDLIKWLSILAVIHVLILNKEALYHQLNMFIKIMSSWKSAARRSSYQVNNLIELVKQQHERD